MNDSSGVNSYALPPINRHELRILAMVFHTLTATRHFVSFLGALGTLLCVACGLGVWYAESRIDRAREHVFERMDQSLSAIGRRVIETQDLAVKSKITLEEIEQRLPDWTRQEASERLAVRFDIDGKAQQLTAGLRQADLVCELLRAMAQQVRSVLEVGDQFGLSWNADSVDPLLERVADVKEDLSQAIDATETITKRLSDDREVASVGERAQQALTVVERLLATFGNVDSRLASLQSRLTDAQLAIGELNAKTHTRIVAGAVCVTLLLLWMAAGQLCMWRRARNHCGSGAATRRKMG